MSGKRRRHGSYRDVADEYYDAHRHPTSANFRTASKAILEAWIPQSMEGAECCDIGAGDSLLAEVAADRGLELSSLTLVDNTPEMLAYSAQWKSRGANLVVGDAEALPFDDDRFRLVVASLGDPYNTPRFWKEARRILGAGGRAIYTTPSFEWADWFRSRNEEPPDAAEFVLQGGERVLVRSFVPPEHEQIMRINSSGLEVVGIYHVLIAALEHSRVSKKLGMPAHRPFVTGYLAVRSQDDRP